MLLLTSCMRLNVDYVIHSQDSIDVTLNYGVEKAMLEEVGQLVTGDQLCSAVSRGRPGETAVVPYEDDAYVGCASTTNASLSTIDDTGRNLKLADGVWTFQLSGTDLEGAGGTGEVTAEAFTDFRVSVTFPGAVITHNGSSTIDGRTVTWTDPADLLTAEGLLATGEDAGVLGGGSTSTALYAGLAIALALLAGLAFWLVRRARTRNAAQTDAPGSPGQPSPAQEYPTQDHPGQPYPTQQYPPQQYPTQEYPGQPYPTQPYPGQPYAAQPDTGPDVTGPDFRAPNAGAPGFTGPDFTGDGYGEPPADQPPRPGSV